LRQCKQVCQRDRSYNLGRHQLWCITHENGQQEIVDEKEKKGRDDEAPLGSEQMLKLLALRNPIPFWLFGSAHMRFVLRDCTLLTKSGLPQFVLAVARTKTLAPCAFGSARSNLCPERAKFMLK
jgi:hypothetical protein